MVAASSKGLGYGVAAVSAREGASVSIARRTNEDIQNAASKLREQYEVDVRGYTFDASDRRSIENWTSSQKHWSKIILHPVCSRPKNFN